MKYYLGCSGYHYKDWKGKFYPDDLPKKQWLSHYAKVFSTVEINNTFYKLPDRSIFKEWYDQTTDDFTFTVKASRYITHMKKLNDAGESISNFYSQVSALEDKLGCVLWQLPGNVHKDLNKLKKFFNNCSKEFNNVIEFRHGSWFDENVYDLLRKNDITFCIISAPDDLPEDTALTSKIAYLRFHGKSKWYQYFYDDEELSHWRDKIIDLSAEKFFIYFNNDYSANAVENCETLREMLK